LTNKKINNPIALEDRGQQGKRLFSPTAGRNQGVIAEALADSLKQNARVLEVGSGTGEHGIATLAERPDLFWQFSDPDLQSRESHMAWMSHAGYDLPLSLNLDVCEEGWIKDLPKYDTIFSANMIHIAPWEATIGLAKGAETILGEDGKICLYGPFLEGSSSISSNLRFDQNLKARNAAWGVRELDSVKHIFAKHGFNRMTRRDMPKNNLFLVLSRQS